MIRINAKPLSVNEAWKGVRYKSDKYKSYEKEIGFQLPFFDLPAPPYKINLEFGMSNILSDFDNPVKPFVDILQKKYGFNDKEIIEANIKKVLTPKGKEYISFSILPIDYPF